MSSKLKAGTSTSGAVLDADTTGILELQTGSTPTTAVTIDTSQNVGIGTASPSSFGKLAVVNGTVGVANTGIDGTTGVCYTFQSPSYGATYQNTIDGSVSSTYSASVIAFKLASGANTTTESMRIVGANLLVGTTNATGDGGGVEVQPNYQNGGFLGLKKTSSSASGDRFQYFVRNGSVIGSITQNGTTGVLYNLTSDYRLKNNAIPLTGASEFIMALQPKTWDWWDGSGKGIGFIAHEFMEVAKHSGNGTKDEVDANGKEVYQSIQPSSSEVMANLVALVQELNAKVDAQAAEIQALKGTA